MGRPPIQIICPNDPDVSFAQITWNIEFHFYHNSPNKDLLDQGLTPDHLEAYTCKPGGLAFVVTHMQPYLDANNHVTGYNETAQRIVLGYCFLYDMGCSLLYVKYDESADIMNKAQQAVEFYDGAKFLSCDDSGLWSSGLPDGVVASVYVHPDNKRALVVMMNSTEKPAEFKLKLDGPKLLDEPSPR